MKEPGADFAFRPKNNTASDERPEFFKSPPKKPLQSEISLEAKPRPVFTVMVNQRSPVKGPLRPINANEESRPSSDREFYKMASSEKESRGVPLSSSRPGSRDASSFDPDSLMKRFDAMRVSTTLNSKPPPAAPNTSARRNVSAQRPESPDLVEIPRDDFEQPSRQSSHQSQSDSQHEMSLPFEELDSFFSDAKRHDPFEPLSSQRPVFGHPTKMMSSLKQKAAGIFNERRSRPEHHRSQQVSAPAVPLYQDRKPEPRTLYSSIGPDANPATYRAPGTFGDTEFYTDPAKASADLKALLEGGMEEDEENKENQDTEAENDGSMEGLKVKLLPHQVDGVEWMRGRELGPVKRGKVPKGGILADDMGLGKTLQTISLILSNQKPAKGETGWKKHFEGIEKTTLVVAPLALIRQWEAEIKDKVARTHGLKVCVHHGPQRTKRYKDLALYDVVVTTYQVLVSEWGHSSEDDSGVKAGCFGLHWWRVVLDEAHTIKNRNAKSTKACYALRSEYRWCLSGTPMQNSLEELQSLIRFLRIKPYDDLKEWKEQIERPLKNGKGHVALRRLHSLLRCFMKRRTKDILKEAGALNPGGKPNKEGEKSTTGFKVTERKVVTVSTAFSPAERRFYDRLEARADESIERMLKGKLDYANALVLLLRLRQACNHPKLVEGKLDKDKDALSSDAPQKNAASDVDSLADMFGGMGIVTKTCGICGRELPKDILSTDVDACQECYDDLAYFKEHETPKRKKPKHKKGKVKTIVEESLVANAEDESPQKLKARRPRNRNVVVDSDDEEADGSWLIPEDQRGQLRMGKAGGEEDENAEGGGDWIGSEDSRHGSEDEEDGSQLDSFVVKDDDVKHERDVDQSFDSDGSLPSIAVIASQATEKRSRSSQFSQPDSESDSEEDTGVDESELYSDDDSRHKPTGQVSQILASAKIRQMMQLLHKEVDEHKFIVFSQFTSMMDLVEPFFRKEGFKFTRYDGSMKNDEREASLHRLRNDKNTRILLCSLKCGSLGLNLTAATRVIILEPFWNPFVEEQAIDRVHRLTQTVDVVVYKLTVEKTVEERILALQEKKRLLAETAIEGGMKKDAFKLGFKEIMDLFRRDAGTADNGHTETQPRISASRRTSPETSGMLPGKARQAAPKRTEHETYGRRW